MRWMCAVLTVQVRLLSRTSPRTWGTPTWEWLLPQTHLTASWWVVLQTEGRKNTKRLFDLYPAGCWLVVVQARWVCLTGFGMNQHNDVWLEMCDRVRFTYFLHWATLPGNILPTHVHTDKATGEAAKSRCLFNMQKLRFNLKQENNQMQCSKCFLSQSGIRITFFSV